MISSTATGTSKQMQKRVDQVSLDCNMLAKSMRSELKNLYCLSDECCIYRVPRQLRELNEKACTPQVVSIGPFHHGKQELEAMEEHKKIYLQHLLQSTEVKLENFLHFIEERETRLRNCYAEAIELSSEDFVRMILLDAVFLILVLVKNYFRDKPDKFEINNDHIFHKPWLIYYVRYDMCLLENQLPFFVLEDLLKLSGIVKHVNGCSMIKLANHFLKGVWGSWVTEDILQKITSSEVEHFVDLLRICQKPSDHKKDKSTKLTSISTPSAVELHQAGVKFRPMPKKDGNWKLHDIKFNINTGRLEIPPLKIVDQTEILLRNLQAFEQCHCANDTYIRNYISIINMLVHSTKDVEMLIQKGIIENWLRGDDAVLSLLRNLSIGNFLIPDVFYFSDLVEDLNKFCEKSRHKWKATLKQNYFSNPWAIISVIAAGFLLMLTITQTVCSIIQVT